MPKTKRTLQRSKKKRQNTHGFRAVVQKKKMSGKKGDAKIQGKDLIKARSAKGRKEITRSNNPRYK